MNLSRRFTIFLTAVAIIFCATNAMAWQKIDDGAFYKKVSVPPLKGYEKGSLPQIIHFFKFDPQIYRLDIMNAKSLGSSAVDSKMMAQKSGSLLAINGGYFTPEYTPLGLLVSQGRELNKLKMIGWWHIFQIKSGKPEVITKQEYSLTPDIEMAIEAGPRLLLNGKMATGLKDTRAERTAIGTTDEGWVIIAVTDSFQITMPEFAKQIKDVGAYNMLNLDGGSSTQLYAKIKGFEINRPGFGPVANGVIVQKR